VAVDRRRTTDRGDQGGDVLDLALDGVRLGVAALATTSPVVVDHCAPLGQLLGERPGGLSVAEHAADHNEGWTGTEAVEGQRGAVVGRDVSGGHGCLYCSPQLYIPQ